MIKSMRIVALCLAVVMMLALFAGCSSEEKKLIGTWYELDSEGNKTNTKIVFAKNGEGTFSGDGLTGTIKWSVDNGKISLTVSVCGSAQQTEGTYKFDGDNLILVDEKGNETAYSK